MLWPRNYDLVGGFPPPYVCALCRIREHRDNLICDGLDIAIRRYPAHLALFNYFGQSTCVSNDHGFSGSHSINYHKVETFGPVWQVNTPAKEIHERRNVIAQSYYNYSACRMFCLYFASQIV
jgi:hypothetical protein